MANDQQLIRIGDGDLFERVVSILEQAHSNVVRSINSNMVLAYWLIGREIVQDLQGGDERAEYGKQVLENLSQQLTAKYGKGFSVTNLKNFRQFYGVFPDRIEIRYPAGSESSSGLIRYPTGDESQLGFSSQLSWSHYRAIMRVSDNEARDFYEREAADCGWTKVQLERQIHSSYYQRIVANRGREGLVSTERERLPGEPNRASDILKSPYVLEFLGLPDSPILHESKLEGCRNGLLRIW